MPASRRPAPDFALPTAEGWDVSLSEFRGRMVIVNFWLSSCAACVDEMSHFQAIHDKWSNEGVVVLAINARQSAARVRSFVYSHGLTFPVLLDAKGEVDDLYQPFLFPTTFFVDVEGVVRVVTEGVFDSPEEIESIMSSVVTRGASRWENGAVTLNGTMSCSIRTQRFKGKIAETLNQKGVK